MSVKYQYTVTITHQVTAESDLDAIEQIKTARPIDGLYEVKRHRNKWWKKNDKQENNV